MKRRNKQQKTLLYRKNLRKFLSQIKLIASLQSREFRMLIMIPTITAVTRLHDTK